MQNYYRVDPFERPVGSIVTPSVAFFDSLKPPEIEVEEIFERVRPSSAPARRGALFLFVQERDARRWAARDRAQRLYEVSVSPSQSVLHVDWAWLGQARRDWPDQSTITSSATQYWSGVLTRSPVAECLTGEGTVVREIEMVAEDYDAVARDTIGTTAGDIASQFRLGF